MASVGDEALAEEWRRLRAMPAHLPATCCVVLRVADRFGHISVDHVTYSVLIRHASRPVWVKLYHDRVATAVGAEVDADHRRAFCRGAKVLDALHVLPLLERKHRAVAEATELLDWRLVPVWQQARAELAKHNRKPDQAWVRMLRLRETHPAAAIERAVRAALERHSPRLETVRLILRQQQADPARRYHPMVAGPGTGCWPRPPPGSLGAVRRPRARSSRCPGRAARGRSRPGTPGRRRRSRPRRAASPPCARRPAPHSANSSSAPSNSTPPTRQGRVARIAAVAASEDARQLVEPPASRRTPTEL